MAKNMTAQQRWDEACGLARQGLETLQEMAEGFGSRFDDMNEGLQASPYGQKCEAMQNLDVADALETLELCEQAEIPLGFGRD